MADVSPTSLPFQEAIDFLSRKVRLPTNTWTDLWEGMHARAFVVAGATKAALVEDFHNAIGKALEQGTTLADFRKDFDKIVATHGWSYKGGRGWRSAVIFNTNMRTSYAAGKWAQIQRVKESRPYLRYVAVMDSRTRDEHRAWHGTVLPADDPWWQTHYPPNGWNCRCTIQQLSDSELERYGYQVSKEAPPVEMEPRQVNTPTGEVTVQVPKGIDTGFGYNVGEAAWGRGAELAKLEGHGPFEPLFVPGGSRPADPGPLAAVAPLARIGKPAANEAELRRMLRDAIGGDERIFADPTGERVLVTQAIIDHMIQGPQGIDGREAFFPFIPELLADPAEIWTGFARSTVTGRVSLRRRYAKLVTIGENRSLGFVADVDGGAWSGLTFFPGETRDLKNLRWGLRVYKKP